MPRKWFTEENTSGLRADELGIINRAARHLVDAGNPATSRLLMEVRMTYAPGMSAQDVVDAVIDIHPALKGEDS